LEGNILQEITTSRAIREIIEMDKDKLSSILRKRREAGKKKGPREIIKR
jgi:hypothetical protein